LGQGVSGQGTDQVDVALRPQFQRFGEELTPVVVVEDIDAEGVLHDAPPLADLLVAYQVRDIEQLGFQSKLRQPAVEVGGDVHERLLDEIHDAPGAVQPYPGTFVVDGAAYLGKVVGQRFVE
jgi:hypothetical protein